MGFLYFLCSVIVLVVAYIIARKFSDIAEMKGHNGNTYFWFTFLFGVCGMLMVIALPYIKTTENTEVTSKNDTPSWLCNEPQTQTVEHVQANSKDINKGNSPVSAEISNGEKICPKCGHSQKADRRVCWSCGQQFDN